MAIGQPLPRDEDDRLLRGAGTYTDDLDAAKPLYMAIMRSPEAAGRIVALDLTHARERDGVVAVVSAAELADVGAFTPRMRHPGPDGAEMRVPPFRPLATESVVSVGDPVAVVLAETRAAAEDALDAIEIDIDPVPPVIGIDAARTADAMVWPQFSDNRCFEAMRGDRDAAAAAVGRAAHVVRRRLDISRVTAVALEPRAVRVVYDRGEWHLHTGTQAPHRVAMDLAPLFGVAPEAIRVTSPDTGGSFGMKNAAYAEQALALWAARAHPGRTIVWTASRLESFLADAHARECVAEATLALDTEGRFLALDVDIAAALGARLGPATTHPPVANLGGLSGVYRIPHIAASVTGYFTNTQFTAPYRGAGRPEATYIIEQMIDAAAAELSFDRAELRRRNLIQPDSMPYDTGFLFTYDSGDFPAVLDRALELSDWHGFPARAAADAQRGRLRGIGLALPIEIAGGPAGKPHPEFARLELGPDRVELRAGSSDSGQGHATAFGQIIAERLGRDVGPVRIVTGDSHQVPQGTGTFGSRTLAAAGTALCITIDRAIAELMPLAAEMLEVSTGDLVFDAGQFRVAGTDRATNLKAVLQHRAVPVVSDVFEGSEGATFPNGAHVCEVEVDPETGAVTVCAYTVVDDVGTVVNPTLVKAQITGGVAQGLGQALWEEAAYDCASGQLLAATLMDYALARAADLPGVTVASLPTATRANPLGVKGVGEAGTVGALSAGISAVNDALARAGAGPVAMPATPVRVWHALRSVK